jgi:hypothetical protein
VPAESDDEPQPDVGTTRRVLYHDEMDMDEEERYDDDRGQPEEVLNESEEEPGSPAEAETGIHSAPPPPPPRPILQEGTPEDCLIEPGTSAQTPSTDTFDSAPSPDNAHEVSAQELKQDLDDDEMAPTRITRPIPPPPVNLSSKPPTSLPSPPPAPRTSLYALYDEDRPESPAPRPVPPPVKSGT